MTQGRSDGEEWVTSYVVSYSLDAYTWKYAADFNGNRKVRIRNIVRYALSLCTVKAKCAILLLEFGRGAHLPP